MAKLDKKTIRNIFIVVAVLVAIGVVIAIWYFTSGDEDEGDGGEQGGGGGGGSAQNYCANPATLDKEKLLKRGMPRNPEVCELQRLLGIKQDGYFGEKTETALLDSMLRKKETTIFDFLACTKGGICD